MAKIKADVGDYKKVSHKAFSKLQLRVGNIVKVTRHPKIPQDYVLLVAMPAADEDIQVVASLAKYYRPAALLRKQVVLVCNIKPQRVAGVESQGMLLISYKGKKPVLVGPSIKCPPGAAVYGMMDGECHHFSEREH